MLISACAWFMAPHPGCVRAGETTASGGEGVATHRVRPRQGLGVHALRTGGLLCAFAADAEVNARVAGVRKRWEVSPDHQPLRVYAAKMGMTDKVETVTQNETYTAVRYLPRERLKRPPAPQRGGDALGAGRSTRAPLFAGGAGEGESAPSLPGAGSPKARGEAGQSEPGCPLAVQPRRPGHPASWGGGPPAACFPSLRAHRGGRRPCGRGPACSPAHSCTRRTPSPGGRNADTRPSWTRGTRS